MSCLTGWLVPAGLILAVALPGCGGADTWEMTPGNWAVTAENEGSIPCSVELTLEGNPSEASTNVLAKGKTFVVSAAGKTVVRTIKVVRGGREELLKPDAALAAGQRFAIVIGADGKVTHSIVDP